MTIEEVQGYALLGMYQEAWDAALDLDPDDRMVADVWRVRAGCAPHLGAWDEGEVLAELLRHGSDNDRMVAFTFFHKFAVHLLALGKMGEAKAAVKKASEAAPARRLALLDDPALAALW
ncbi:hypothetical protein [Luteolibacter ambystomatis]